MSDLVLVKQKLQNLNVLFVDDEESIRESTGRFLMKFFNQVTLAADGEEGLKKFREDHFDVVISDVLMPKKTGPEMAQEIIKLDPKVLLAFVTASRDHDEYAIGIKSFKVTKPLSFDVITGLMKDIADSI